ncbi:unnamed protein product, partial [marine sediment metagenome]
GFWGSINDFVEIGAGITFYQGLYYKGSGSGPDNSGYSIEKIEKSKFNTLYLTFRMGYRFQKPNGGLFIRIGIIPFIKLHDFNEYEAMKLRGSYGFGFGYNFKTN